MKTFKKLAVIGGAIAAGAGGAMAQSGPTYSDPTSVVTSAGTLAAAAMVVALAILTWRVGARIVSKLVK